MVRSPFYDKNGVKKGAWSPEEDNKLKAYIEKYGHWNWRLLPKFAGLSRCGKSCRLRWVNYLRPDLKRGNYTKEEEDLIIKLHEELGNKWSLIATKLPGRTDNEIKNYWHSHLRKRLLQNPNTSQSSQNTRSSEPEISSSLSVEASSKYDASSSGESILKPNDNELVSSNSMEMLVDESGGDFWTQPFVPESDFYSSFGSANHHVQYNCLDDDLDYHFYNQVVMHEFGETMYQ